MLTELFLKLLNMSIAASWLVLAVLALRCLFRKMPKWISCLLWGIVALRLLIPFSVESTVSLVPSRELIPQDVLVTQNPVIDSGIPVVDGVVNPALTQQVIQSESQPGTLLSTATAVWLAGAVLLLLYSAGSYLLLRFRVRAFLSPEKGIRVCDDISSPFVLGIFFPKIYLPSGMDSDQTGYVLDHERAHIQRKDYLWKPLGYLLLTVYWFNPLLWLSYILLCRDIERACDEKVVAKLNSDEKKGYSQALLTCGIHRRMLMACPVAFGEVSIKSRVKGVLCYKKPSVWILLVSATVCVVLAVCFLTDPISCPHTYDIQTVQDATCAEPGIRTNLCTLCGHSYCQPISVQPHSYKAGSNNTVTCSRCGSLGGTQLPCAEGKHSLQTKFLYSPSYTAAGKSLVFCTRCGYQEEIITPALQWTDSTPSGTTGTSQSVTYPYGTSRSATSNTIQANNCSIIGHMYVMYGDGTQTCSSCGAISNWISVPGTNGFSQNSTYQSPLSSNVPTVGGYGFGQRSSTGSSRYSNATTPNRNTGLTTPGIRIFP